MNKPYVICHMTVSIDGKVTGDFLSDAACAPATELYYEINRRYRADAYACGRVTMEGSFTGGMYPDLEEYFPLDSSYLGEDFITDERTGFYAVAFDPHGRLGWQYRHIIDADKDPGYDDAQIIEVLTRKADPRYLTYLRETGISYIYAGEAAIDVEMTLQKLKSIFGIGTLLLEGGSILNGTFQQAGVIDELSLVMAPITADTDGKPLFSQGVMETYKLSSVEDHNGILWLNYKKHGSLL